MDVWLSIDIAHIFQLFVLFVSGGHIKYSNVSQKQNIYTLITYFCTSLNFQCIKLCK